MNNGNFHGDMNSVGMPLRHSSGGKHPSPILITCILFGTRDAQYGTVTLTLF